MDVEINSGSSTSSANSSGSNLLTTNNQNNSSEIAALYAANESFFANNQDQIERSKAMEASDLYRKVNSTSDASGSEQGAASWDTPSCYKNSVRYLTSIYLQV